MKTFAIWSAMLSFAPAAYYWAMGLYCLTRLRMEGHGEEYGWGFIIFTNYAIVLTVVGFFLTLSLIGIRSIVLAIWGDVREKMKDNLREEIRREE